MKTKIFATALLGLFALVSCDKSNDFSGNDAPLAILNVDVEGISTLTRANIPPILGVTAPLSADEIEFLFAIREDEKLAHDLYSVFAALYPTSTQIAKIKTAENSHIACIEAVLDYYEIEYPAMTPAGIFADVERQALYNKLVDKSATLLEAYGTMAAVEEESVSAYKSVQSGITNVNISLVITNIIKASSNHLKAAVRQITALGGSYTPTYLSAEEFDVIINSAFQNGNKYGQQKGQGGKGGNTNAQKGNQGQGGNKGGVNGTGTCTGTSNGTAPGTGGQGGVGKGYRGGR